jgi:hypothetical protein
MLCSRCSGPVAPVVALDIDGTLADYHSHLLRFANRWTGYVPEGPVYNGSEPFHEWFTRTYGVDRSTFRAIKLAFRQGGMKRFMPVYYGARDLTIALQDNGAEVWLTTTRPHQRFDRVDPDTREWVLRNELEMDGLLFGENKMSELAERIDPERVVGVLDDLPGVLDDVRRLGLGQPLFREQMYNVGARWTGPRVPTLWEARDVLNRWVNEWKEHYA